MNTNELTLDGYLGLPFGARLSASLVANPKTRDQWSEGEQHCNPFYGGGYHTPSSRHERTEQDILWEHGIYVTMTTGCLRALVSHQHWTPELPKLVASILGRPIQIAIYVRLQPWECHPKKRVLTTQKNCEIKEPSLAA